MDTAGDIGAKVGRPKDDAISQSPDNGHAILATLTSWLGPHVKSVALTPYEFSDTGRGMKARNDINAGSRLISVSSKFCFTARRASLLHPEIPQKLLEQPLTYLTAFLLLENQLGEKSTVFPYIQSLPKSFSNPFFTSRGRIPVGVCKSMRALFEEQERDFGVAVGLLKWKKWDFNDILWAWFVVQTRTLFISPTEPALVPFLDLFNHSPHARVITQWNSNDSTFEITTETPYKAGEQVFINYGSHDNMKLAVYYGFTVPENPFSEVELEMDQTLKLLPVSLGQGEFLRSYQAWKPLSVSRNGFSLTSKLFLRARLTARKDLWTILDSEELPDSEETRKILIELLREKFRQVTVYSTNSSRSPVISCVYEEVLVILQTNIEALLLTKFECT